MMLGSAAGLWFDSGCDVLQQPTTPDSGSRSHFLGFVPRVSSPVIGRPETSISEKRSALVGKAAATSGMASIASTRDRFRP